MNGAKPARLPTLTITPKKLTALDTRECSTWNIIQCSAAFITLGEFEINAVMVDFNRRRKPPAFHCREAAFTKIRKSTKINVSKPQASYTSHATLECFTWNNNAPTALPVISPF